MSKRIDRRALAAAFRAQAAKPTPVEEAIAALQLYKAAPSAGALQEALSALGRIVAADFTPTSILLH